MDNSNKSYPANLITFVKKKHIFFGIVFLIIIVGVTLFNLSNPKTLPLHINVRQQSINATSKLFSIIYQMRASTTTTITKSDDISCVNVTDFNTMDISQNLCKQINCSIVLRRSGGRLGNRMFMFASAYGLSRLHNCRLHVSPAILGELSAMFQMKTSDEIEWLSEGELNKLKNIQEKTTVCSFLTELIRPNAFENLELMGYWQSYLYFDAYREEIREIFSAKHDTLLRLSAYFTNITNTFRSLPNPTTHKEFRQIFQAHYNITWIGIHIRRGDFHGLGFSSNDQYIRRSMSFFRKRYYQNQIRFLIASDDKGYCRELFASELKSGRVFILPDSFSPVEDLMALSLCHHSIVTGGTYGFWSAYLTGGEVIHDIRYQAGCSRSDYYPPWFMLVGTTIERKS